MKHMMSVQKLWELVPNGFILLESDVLLKKSIDFLWDERFAATGKVRHFQRAVTIDDVVIANVAEATCLVPYLDILCGVVLALGRSCTMHDDPHTLSRCPLVR